MDKRELLQLRLAGHTYQFIADKAGISRQRVQQLLSPPKFIRAIIVKESDGKCALCGLYVGEAGQVHHRNLDYEGDYQDIDNLQLLCVSCHLISHGAGELSMNKDNGIKKLRQQLMLDQQEFADKMAVDKGTVSRWERGVQRPKAVHLRRIDRLRKTAERARRNNVTG